MPRITKPLTFLAAVTVIIQPIPAPFVALIPPAVAVGMASVASVVSAAGTVAGSVAEAIEAANKLKKPCCIRHIPQGSAWPPDANQLAWQACKGN